jgi:GNAT superfamily N-acetyltransferase
MADLRFDRLTEADLADAVGLSTQAGWNQLPEDWKRILDLSPAGCFAGRIDGRLVATSTVASYGNEAHWIGMVLVDEAERGKGYGKAILKRAIDHGLSLGSEAIGLDATDLGRPVYLKEGLVDVAPIDRWGGAPKEVPGAGRLERLDRSNWDEAALLDRDASGVDRAPLLLHLAQEPATAGWIVREGSALAGYAFLRPGRRSAHLGPVVAEETAYYATLISAAARHLRGAGLIVDALRDEGTTQVLERAGLEVKRRLTRMTLRSPQRILMGDRIGAATAFEWG